jgi:hypothetical protein
MSKTRYKLFSKILWKENPIVINVKQLKNLAQMLVVDALVKTTKEVITMSKSTNNNAYRYFMFLSKEERLINKLDKAKGEDNIRRGSIIKGKIRSLKDGVRVSRNVIRIPA